MPSSASFASVGASGSPVPDGSGGHHRQGRTARLREQRLTLGIERKTEALLVYRAVVPAAQQHQVLQLRRAAVGPMLNVVGIATRRLAAGKAAVLVARCEGPAQCRRNRPGLAADVKDVAISVVAHHHLPGVAGETPRRFRGNADAA